MQLSAWLNPWSLKPFAWIAGSLEAPPTNVSWGNHLQCTYREFYLRSWLILLADQNPRCKIDYTQYLCVVYSPECRMTAPDSTTQENFSVGYHCHIIFSSSTGSSFPQPHKDSQSEATVILCLTALLFNKTFSCFGKHLGIQSSMWEPSGSFK